MFFSWKKLIQEGRVLSSIAMVVIMIMSGIFSAPLVGYAQSPEDLETFGATVNEFDIDLDVTPENPEPFAAVRLFLDSNVVDLNKYTISWFVDGVVKTSGMGARNFTVTAGGYGSEVQIQALIELPDGVIRKSLTLSPQPLTVMWEAIDSYVPAFYPGKKLPSREAFVKFVAIPGNVTNMGNKSPKTYVYNWKRNGTIVTDAGGYGKDSFTIKHNRIRGTENIEVSASGVSEGGLATRSLTLALYEPKILFYEISDKTGIRSWFAKRSIYFAEARKKIIAEPYFMSVAGNNPNRLDVQWRMNNQPIVISDIKQKTLITLKNQDSAGTATIDVTFANTNRPLQTKNATLGILFQVPE